MRLESKTLRFRLVEEEDARFILNLRLDERYNKYLSPVAGDVSSQKGWIKKYKKDEAAGRQYYFIIERISDGHPCGTVRVYDIRENSFCWGSWILNENKTRFSALESAFLVYEFGFDILGYNKSHFDVVKDNVKVVSFHERMGAVMTGQDDFNYYFEISKESVSEARERLKGKVL